MVFAMLGSIFATSTMALEVLTEEDFVQGVVVENQLIRVADNAIFLMDTSSSMNDEYLDTGKSKLEVALAEFKRRNNFFPPIGHKFGIYSYTLWEEIYPVQVYDREKVAAALEALPTEGSGPTPLAYGVGKAEEVIKNLSGRTVLFLFYDGNHTDGDPDPALWRLAKENDVCLMLISSADDEETERLQRNVSRLNSCSRAIPYQQFIDRPEYTTHALFDVIATVDIITFSEKRVSGVKVSNIDFGFDKTKLGPHDKAELDALGEFLTDNPASYAVLAGYSDDIGDEEYNEHLSQLRTETVASYLMKNHGIDDSRLVLYWHGSDNPIASNNTDEGRAKNRRVEIGVGGV